MQDHLEQHRAQRNLTTLVENKTTYSAEFSELNLFETHTSAEKVALTFDYPVIASMLTGKKVMHLEGMPDFDFFPGESVVMPANEEMVIDFPIATLNDPTQCLALGIEPAKINDVVDRFNWEVEIESENNNWNLDHSASHLVNNFQVKRLLDSMLFTFVDGNKSKDILLDLMVQELIVHLLQSKARRAILLETQKNQADTRLGTAIQYIRKHLTDKNFSVEALAKNSCMSVSHFHKKFKDTFGVSPIDYVNAERIKFAKQLIRNKKHLAIGEVAFLAGYNSTSYFNRQFKKFEEMTPMRFRKELSKMMKH